MKPLTKGIACLNKLKWALKKMSEKFPVHLLLAIVRTPPKAKCVINNSSWYAINLPFYPTSFPLQLCCSTLFLRSFYLNTPTNTVIIIFLSQNKLNRENVKKRKVNDVFLRSTTAINFFWESRPKAPHPSPIIKMTIQPLGPVNRQPSLRGNHIKYFSEQNKNH